MRRLLSSFRLFRRSEEGQLSVETVMVIPLLLFAYAGLFTFFDAFRTVNLNTRASYTIADMLSRETNPVDDAYIEGLNKILSVLTASSYDTILRVTVVTWDDNAQELQLVWSAVDGGTGTPVAPITEGTLTEVEGRVPIMAHGDINIVVETWSGFVPMMAWHGVESQYYHHTAVTRPRFAPQLCWETCIQT